MLHHFKKSIAKIDLPKRFTYPFNYIPHPLSIIAAEELQAYISSKSEWAEELKQGKMFGVLIVGLQNGESKDIGYIVAFSGNLIGKNKHPYFVPPVYDMLEPNGFFRQEEENISKINSKISTLEKDPKYLEIKQKLDNLKTQLERELKKAKLNLKTGKETRETRRKEIDIDDIELAEMIKESQFQKAEYKRLELNYKKQIEELETDLNSHTNEIENLKIERKNRSSILQQRLFDKFKFLNADGETKNLCRIFEETIIKTPPAGAGECAAPKLLEYAYLEGLKPLAMAEFWWGESPKTEIRHHCQYYPSCTGKCKPILKHMLKGLNIDPNPLLTTNYNNMNNTNDLEILFEDKYLLVVNKPSGMLSVPGKTVEDSVYTRMRTKYPEATGPLTVHRLDMATSGLLLIAKTKEIHKNLQTQFQNRTIKKRYIALLDGIIAEDEGRINLSICPDLDDRPRQMVSEKFGKEAITDYKVIERRENQTLVALYPITGRTHQLRIHTAHPLGLNTPIFGDELYGKKADKLHLHAEYLEFQHPVTKEIMEIEKKA